MFTEKLVDAFDFQSEKDKKNIMTDIKRVVYTEDIRKELAEARRRKVIITCDKFDLAVIKEALETNIAFRKYISEKTIYNIFQALTST